MNDDIALGIGAGNRRPFEFLVAPGCAGIGLGTEPAEQPRRHHQSLVSVRCLAREVGIDRQMLMEKARKEGWKPIGYYPIEEIEKGKRRFEKLGEAPETDRIKTLDLLISERKRFAETGFAMIRAMLRHVREPSGK